MRVLNEGFLFWCTVVGISLQKQDTNKSRPGSLLSVLFFLFVCLFVLVCLIALVEQSKSEFWHLFLCFLKHFEIFSSQNQLQWAKSAHRKQQQQKHLKRQIQKPALVLYNKKQNQIKLKHNIVIEATQ